MSDLALLGTHGIADPNVRNFLDRFIQVWQTKMSGDDSLVSKSEFAGLTADVLSQALSDGVIGGADGGFGQQGGVAQAIDVLTQAIRSTVIQQVLEQNVQPRIDEVLSETRSRLSEEAAARAAALLQEAQARGADIATEATLRQASDTSLASQISLVTAGVAGGFDYGVVWYFDGGVEGWTSSGATQAANNGWVDITSTGADPQFISPVGLNITGSTYPVVKARIKRLAGTGWDGKCLYATAGHGFDAGHYKAIPEPTPFAPGDAAIVEFAMDSLDAGGTDWVASVIDRIRLEFGADAADIISVDWVAIGRNAPGASMAGLLSEQTARATADTAEATARLALAATVSGHTAAITAEQTARADGDAAQTSALNTQISRIDTVESSVTSESSTRSTKDNALASAINRVWSFIGGTTAVIEDGALASTTPSSAVATKWNNVIAAVTDPNTGNVSSASILTETRTYANSANSTFNALYQVKAAVSAGGQTVVGGFALSATGGAGSAQGPTIDFGVLANKFYIAAPSSGYNPASEYSTNLNFPFIVITTPTVLNGVTYQPGVYMKRAAIGQASIGTAEIQNAAITNAKIGDASITNAKIAGALYSDNWNGSQGWYIGRDGQAYFNRIVLYGVVFNSVFVPNNTFVSVFHGSNRYIAVTLWSGSGTPNLVNLDGSQFTVRLDFSSGGVVYYAYV